jgi:LPS sulfotransferase NodH
MEVGFSFCWTPEPTQRRNDCHMVKFILLSHARSGSTLIALALGQHEAVRMYGELFNDEEQERKNAFRAGKPVFRNGREIFRSQNGLAEYYDESEDGATFLREQVFYKRYLEQPFAVGFKIFYNQSRKSQGTNAAWHYLADDKDIHIIHLKRRNLLASLVSLHVAFATDEWARPIGTNMPRLSSVTLSLDPERCKSYFDEIEAGYQWANKSFEGHPKIEIDYEKDVCDCFSTTMQNIESFLGIPYQMVEKLIEKQEGRKLCEIITNYESLGQYFKNSCYSEFFH